MPTSVSLWPPSFDAAIFDFDGTLADTAALWREVDEAFLSKRGLTYDDEYQRMLTILGFEAGARYTIERFGLEESVDEICKEWNRMGCELYRNRVVLRPGAERYIHMLKQRGIVCALATINEPDVLCSLQSIDVYQLFDTCVHGRDVARPKDHPDIYLEAAQRLNVTAERCIVFEDIACGLRSARSVHMQTCAVRTDDPIQDFAELRSVADASLNEWTDLIEQSS